MTGVNGQINFFVGNQTRNKQKIFLRLVLIGFEMVEVGAGVDKGGWSTVVFFEAVLGIF